MAQAGSRWRGVAQDLGAVLLGLVVGLAAANVWPLLLISLGAAAAAAVEVLFLGAYVAWFSGAIPGPWRRQRLDLGRGRMPARGQWGWGLLAAFAFAATVHAAIVVLFRLVAFPAAAFHAGYDFSFIPGLKLQWLACVVSALSAGVCEEMGFRGYLQRPLERRRGVVAAVLVSSLLFMLLHLNKSWSLMAMTPVVFAAGLMLGALASASGTLLFCMLGHWLMDIGLFAYWWTQIAGVFRQRPVFETGVDAAFGLEAAVLALAAAAFLFALRRLARKNADDAPRPQPMGPLGAAA
jgi:membrane protease YdiL (CAAX protease family)